MQFLEKVFLPRDFEGAKSLEIFSGIYLRNNLVSEGLEIMIWAS